MSNQIPIFNEGDKVRIMNTTEMTREGIANKQGTVICQFKDLWCIVQLDNSIHVAHIQNHSLMKV